MTPELEALPDDSLLPRDSKRSLPMSLLRAREAVMARFRPILAARDISEQQWRVMRVLAEAGPLDATEVAERACLLAPSLTRIMRTLEERRLITRTRDAGDARRIRLMISAAGIAMIGEVVPAGRDIFKDIEMRFGRERLDHLLDMLGDLAILKP